MLNHERKQLIKQRIDLHHSRINHAIAVIDKVSVFCVGFSLINIRTNHLAHNKQIILQIDSLVVERFDHTKIPKCNSIDKVGNMFESWVYNGVTNEKSLKSCQDYIDNYKWFEYINWTFTYILDCAISHCESILLDKKISYPKLLREICLSLDTDMSVLDHVYKTFPIQQIFNYSSKRMDSDCLLNGAAGKLYGKPSQRWSSFSELFDYITSDVPFDVMELLHGEFLVSKGAKWVRNKDKLRNVRTAYYSGYQYAKWILQVSSFCTFILKFLDDIVQC